MAIPVEIVSNGKRLHVNGEGEIGVVVHSHPPINEPVESYPFSQWFTDNGLSSGSNDMRVNGATASQDFYIQARSDRDIFIKSISILISDAGARLNLFGALAALTNGVDFLYKNNNLGEVIIQDEIKTNLQFIRLCHDTPGVGDGATAFRADVSGSGADSYLPVMDMQKTFGFPWGLHLKKGSIDRLIFRINDNISSGLDNFNIKGTGIQI